MATITKTVRSTATVVHVDVETQTATVVKHGPAPPAKTVTAIHTVTAPPTASASFSGVGEKSVGTVNVHAPSTLHWSCSGGCEIFAIDNDPGDDSEISLDSNGSGGTTALDPGVYHDVKVLTSGSWTFRIVPGA